MSTLFVSYSHLDWKDWVKPLVEAIQAQGHVVAVADIAMRVGDPIPDWIRQRVTQADLALLCWSPAAAQSPWVQAERRLLAAHLKRVVWAERNTPHDEILRRIAAPTGPLLLAAPADADRAQTLFQALDLTPTPITAADTPLPVLRDAVNSGRPLIVLWSQAAAHDPSLRNFLDQVLMQDLSAGRRRLYLHSIDGTPADALHAAIRGATFSDLEALARELNLTRRRLHLAPLPRPELEQRYGRILQRQGGLLLLSPRHGGARPMARRLIEQSSFGERFTELRPPRVADLDRAQFFEHLTGDPAVRSAHDYMNWQRARAGQAAHLIALLHDGGPIEHLRALTEALRTLRTGSGNRFSLLVAGSSHAATLANGNLAGSFLSDLWTEHVPDLTPVEVKFLLGSVGEPVDDRLALEAHAATGGYLRFIEELLIDDDPLDPGAISTRLCHSVRRILWSRLKQDDAEQTLPPEQHAAEALRRLLIEGESRERLEAIGRLLEYGETRLHYDGLLRLQESGKLVLRCEAVRQVAEEVLRLRGRWP